MDRDKLFGGTDPVRLRNATYHVIDRTQDDMEVQLKAVGLAFFCMCDALKVDPRELLVACERMRDAQDGPHVPTFRAIEEYTQTELRRYL